MTEQRPAPPAERCSCLDRSLRGWSMDGTACPLHTPENRCVCTRCKHHPDTCSRKVSKMAKLCGICAVERARGWWS